jgi:putative transposase
MTGSLSNIRKNRRHKSHLLEDEKSREAQFYLALNNISKKWTMPLRDWKGALNRFTIQFEERMKPN